MLARVAAGLSVAFVMGVSAWARQSVPAPAAQNALVRDYCSGCHNTTSKAGGLALQGFDVDSPLLSAELLERMIRKVRSDQMPPYDVEQPAPAELTSLADTLEARADALSARRNDPGWRPFQRLNRAEYARVIADLLAVEIDPSAILPPDTSSGGFDNIADVQTVSPALITAYLRGAATVSRLAVGVAGARTPSRARIFTCVPRARPEETACASTIVRRLLTSAYRGAATDVDIADAMSFYERGRRDASFDDGVRLALQSILVSPKFLFRLEPPTTSPWLSDVALASRLSFFLWSRGPDAELIAAAQQGRLHTPEQLSLQARRMLADPRAEALSTRFAAQWLRLQDLEKNGADRTLAKAMRRETELTVADLIRRDGDVMELITSNRSFINARLAAHYGIADVRGDQFRAVTMPDSRRGLLGQGSILTLTSLATRTSPVLRGKWVLDVLLGIPPSPPPPNVPSLDDSAPVEPNGAPLSTRQRVEAHRRNPSCAGCHRLIDPLGMTLEHFDATGAWRVTENGAAIDTTADLYDGRRMVGVDGLRAALVAHQDLVVRNFTQQLMTYALGRRLTYRDMPAVRAIVRGADANHDRISAFVTGVVSGEQFRISRPAKDR